MTVDDSFWFEHAPCGLVWCCSDGKIVKVNATFAQWLGYSKESLEKDFQITDLLSIGSKIFYHTHWLPLMHLQGEVMEVLIELKGANQNTIPTLLNANTCQKGDEKIHQLAFFIVKDRQAFEKELIRARADLEQSLNELAATQNQLQESRDFLSLAIASARMGILTYSRATSKLNWSTELRHLTGHYDEKWDRYTEFKQLIHTEDLPLFRQKIKQAIIKKQVYEVEFRLKKATGEWLTMISRGQATYDDQGNYETVFGVFIDVSEQKATEQALSDLNEMLTQSDKQKDEFLATLGHELRNPLAPIRNIIEIMREKSASNDSLSWYHDVLDRHVSQMTHIVDDLLEITRISQGRLELRKEHVDLKKLVQLAIESTLPMIKEAQHQVTVEQPEASLLVDGDPTRLTQVIVNLLTNAVKYTPEQGIITVALAQRTEQIEVSVSDTGIGIPDDKLTSIFNMFSRLEPALQRDQGGLGIGLALVHGLVTMHGGTVTAQSDGPGKGSQFTVSLPKLVGEFANSQSSEPTTTSTNGYKRILIIDDNIDAVDSLAVLLEFEGHHVTRAYDGHSGISQAKQHLPDVIISDIGLPDISGYEVAKQIRATTWGQPIFLIALTGWGQKKDRELAFSAGFNKHFTKPLDYSELKQLLAGLPAPVEQ